jgi:hypothetical protein
MVIARVIPQRLQLQAQVTSASLSDVTIPESAQSRTRVDRCLSALKERWRYQYWSAYVVLAIT